MNKKWISVVLSLCMLLCTLPLPAGAYPGDIWLPDGEKTQTFFMNGEKILGLKNDAITLMLDGSSHYKTYLITMPTLAEGTGGDVQADQCYFVIWSKGEARKIPVYTTLKKAEFVTETPNGNNTGIRATYDAPISFYYVDGIPNGTTISAQVTVYHELVKLAKKPEEESSTWGVLTSVGEVQVDRDSFPGEAFPYDFAFEWGYYMSNFTGMGHGDTSGRPGGPAIRMSRTTVTESGEMYTENSTITSSVEDLSTKHVPKGYSAWGDMDGVYLTEIFVDSYPWANPFVGTSDYYEKEISIYGEGKQPLRVSLPYSVSVRPRDTPVLTHVITARYLGFTFEENSEYTEYTHYLWGFRDLISKTEDLPTQPDTVDSSFTGKRLAAFRSGNTTTVEYVADDAALESLKKKYKASPVAVITGECESKNGSEYTFSGNAARLSPSVTATWNPEAGGKLVIHRDGTVEQTGVHLNAPSFKFYQPKSGAEDSLGIELTAKGFSFAIDPKVNDAILYVDIPYATAKLAQADADNEGNLVFRGEIGFKTLFDGASFTLEKLGYGLKETDLGNGKKGYEFKVNGVQAKGIFDTTKLLSLELAKVEGEVNTFRGEERYAFSLELNAFELFETEASLALERSDKGALLPDELWFYVKASPGIVLVPPVPIGQLNGGGAGFKDLVATVNGDYFAIPPLKLRGALTGTYLHLIEGTGNVVLGPSEISLKATDVNIVGAGAATQIVDSFGYTLKLNGMKRNYKGETYQGIYFAGSKELSLKLPSKAINMIEVETGLELGAFGGANQAKNRVHLAIGANGTATGTIKVPDNSKILPGMELSSAKVNLIAGGQTTFPVRGVSVNEGLKDAFKNVDVYLGAMAEIERAAFIFDVRAWALIPRIVQTKFKYGAGWGFEANFHNHLSDWNWEDKGVTPVVQSAPMLLSLASAASPTANINVTAEGEETPYILLAFDKTVTEEEVKNALTVSGKSIDWTETGLVDPASDITAVSALVTNNQDGQEHRVVLLRLKSGGSYYVDANGLAFTHEEAAVNPFEKLNATLQQGKVTGSVDYSKTGETYVLRTYLANTKDGADYLIDERELDQPGAIDVTLPTSGALAPSGDYYVTTYLMTERKADLNDDGQEEEALITIDHCAFDQQLSYQNTNEPAAPETVSLQPAGNEVMRADWKQVDGADGYAVTVYREDNGKWIDTGFGYDLAGDQTGIDMALTVGGNGVSVNEDGSVTSVLAKDNLQANQTYRIGVKAYKSVEDGKYYSKESLSADRYLPEYQPLAMELAIDSQPCVAEKNSVYQACVGSGSHYLTVKSADNAATYQVRRMDTDELIQPENGEYLIPEAEGTLMLQVDGISGLDVTSEYILISFDKEPPLLTLSSDVFYADSESGAYAITGMADAGSQVFYDKQTSETVGSNGAFSVSGVLEEGEESKTIVLSAQDSAGNVSQPKLALVVKQPTTYLVTVKDSYSQEDGSGEYTSGETVTVRAGSRSGYTFAGWSSEDGITFADSTQQETTFQMPDQAVTVTARWTKDSSGGPGGGGGGTTYYTVTFETNNGLTMASVRVAKNQQLAEPAAPTKENAVFVGWYTDPEGKNKYDFSSAVTGDLTLYAKWMESGGEKPWENPFTDVRPGDWFYSAVEYAVSRQLMVGTAADLFEPDTPLTRAMLVTVLWRAEGSEKTEGALPFNDVKEGSYYADAVRWAAQNGLVSGMGEGVFAPDQMITREQIAAILFRYAQSKGKVESASVNLQSYADYEEISEYAVSAMAYAVGCGLIRGKTETTLNPRDCATRAEAAAILQRFLEEV